jgi:hypothetical protein
MMKIINFLILSLLFTSVVAQQTFYTHIHDSNVHHPSDILIKPDGNMLFCSFYRSDDTSWSSIWELDHSGEIINEWTFTNTSEEFLRCFRILQVDKQIFLFGEGQKNIKGNIEEFVSMRVFDTLLNEIENYCFSLSGMPHQALSPCKVINRDSKFHIFTAIEYDTGWYTPGYLKVSSAGTKLHTAFLPTSSGQVLCPYDMCLIPGSDNLFTLVFDGLTLFNTFGVFTEFDTAMNIVSQFPLITESGPSIPDFGIVCNGDITFYMMYNVGSPTQLNSIVDKRDLEGNILNQFVYECPEDSASYIAFCNALDTLPDGNLIFCTTKNIDLYPGVQQEPTQIRLFKLTPNLELIWQKYLFGDAGNYRVWSMKTHPDGGIVVLGTFSRTPPQSGAMEIFFMKTDSEGNLTVGFDENEQQMKTTEAILYPNPASDFINIEFSQAYQTASFQLMDIGGKMVFEKQLNSNFQSINISALPARTYVFRIFNKDGLDERGKVVVE